MSVQTNSKSKALLIAILITFGVGLSFILLGSLFKLQHWVGASILLVTGLIAEAVAMILITIYLVKSIMKPKMPTNYSR